jgi:hypothetical protein
MGFGMVNITLVWRRTASTLQACTILLYAIHELGAAPNPTLG